MRPCDSRALSAVFDGNLGLLKEVSQYKYFDVNMHCDGITLIEAALGLKKEEIYSDNLELMNYPLSNLSFDNAKVLLENFNQSPILADVLTVNSVSASNQKTTIKLVNNVQEYLYKIYSVVTGFFDPDSGGIYSSSYNNELNKDNFIHESTHSIMQILFDDNLNPYSSEQEK